jgi:hypothetical protein
LNVGIQRIVYAGIDDSTSGIDHTSILSAGLVLPTSPGNNTMQDLSATFERISVIETEIVEDD